MAEQAEGVAGKGGQVAIRLDADGYAELVGQAAERGLTPTRHAHECLLDGIRRARPGVSVVTLPSGGELTVWPA